MASVTHVSAVVLTESGMVNLGHETIAGPSTASVRLEIRLEDMPPAEAESIAKWAASAAGQEALGRLLAEQDDAQVRTFQERVAEWEKEARFQASACTAPTMTKAKLLAAADAYAKVRRELAWARHGGDLLRETAPTSNQMGV